MSSNEPAGDARPSYLKAPQRFGRLIILSLCLAIIAAGAGAYIVIVRSAPKATKRPPVKLAPLVTVQKVYPRSQAVTIHVMGSVVPARELRLKSRVAGQVVYLHPEFAAGGIVRQNDSVVRIDDRDYKLIVAQKQSGVADASFNLKLELGRQDVARREWKLLNGDSQASEAGSALALRKPHLKKSQSDLKAARAELDAALLQLARTDIRAPFNAIIRATHVEMGSQVAAQENLATLVGTDEYWVQASVPVDRLQWIKIPDSRRHKGAPARITYHGDAVRSGRVTRLLGDLESQGRMARLIVAIHDPLGLQGNDKSLPAMLIGEYVRVQIEGRRVESAYRIPRTALRNNTHLWVAGQDDRLRVLPVAIIWRDTQTVLVREGLQPGDRVIVSDLSTPVPGMTVKVTEAVDGPLKPASLPDAKPVKGTPAP